MPASHGGEHHIKQEYHFVGALFLSASLARLFGSDFRFCLRKLIGTSQPTNESQRGFCIERRPSVRLHGIHAGRAGVP
jgi:hypothetical protein